MIDQLSERIFKNWKTTTISVVLFGGLAFLGFKGLADWDTLSGWFTTAGMFLFFKDGNAKPEPSTPGV
jgi:hypothetical protein